MMLPFASDKDFEYLGGKSRIAKAERERRRQRRKKKGKHSRTEIANKNMQEYEVVMTKRKY
jgi:hypothetical protein